MCAYNPVHAGLLGTQAAMMQPQRSADAIQSLGRRIGQVSNPAKFSPY